MILGGEGSVTEFTGPGRVGMQTRSAPDLVDWLRTRMPSSSRKVSQLTEMTQALMIDSPVVGAYANVIDADQLLWSRPPAPLDASSTRHRHSGCTRLWVGAPHPPITVASATTIRECLPTNSEISFGHNVPRSHRRTLDCAATAPDGCRASDVKK